MPAPVVARALESFVDTGTPAYKVPAEQVKVPPPSGDTPDDVPDDEAPDDEAPDDEAPEDEAPDEDAPDEEAPDDEAPEEDAPELPELDESPASGVVELELDEQAIMIQGIAMAHGRIDVSFMRRLRVVEALFCHFRTIG